MTDLRPGLDDSGSSAPGLRLEPDPVPSVLTRALGFSRDGVWDVSPPSAGLAIALEEAVGPDADCPGATRDELVGMLRQSAALEARAASQRLAVLRALARNEDLPGDQPGGWSKSLSYEAAAALAVSVPTADNMLWLARDLETRLPGVGDLLADGTLAYAKARAVSETFQLLTDEDAARAEALILDQLPGRNFGQVKKLAEQAAITVDPEAATRRREHAERENARVQLFREDSGAAALSGRDLPTDDALAAHARVNAVARQLKDSGAFAEARLDQLRAAAYLDLLNGIPAEARIALGVLPGTADPDRPGVDGPHGSHGPHGPGGSGPDLGDSDSGPGSSGSGDSAPDDGNPGPGAITPLRPVDLIIPLSTLLGLAARPGEGHGLGPLDPGLCAALAASAAASPDSRWCVTVTDEDGIAIGHGCAKPPRSRHQRPAAPAADHTSLPSRVNLTIPAGRLAGLARSTGPPGRTSWSFTPDPGPPGGLGRWTLRLPGNRELIVQLEPMPTVDCDHRHESHAYQPNDTLRHLVQVRDYECTFPQCNRHARDSDFEHAQPYDQGGRTCACNAGARSRACHRVKQSKGWTVTQPRPGWHRWETPAGRVYTQGPKRYPA